LVVCGRAGAGQNRRGAVDGRRMTFILHQPKRGAHSPVVRDTAPPWLPPPRKGKKERLVRHQRPAMALDDVVVVVEEGLLCFHGGIILLGDFETRLGGGSGAKDLDMAGMILQCFERARLQPISQVGQQQSYIIHLGPNGPHKSLGDGRTINTHTHTNETQSTGKKQKA
jgi:hypothetical protein